MHYFKNIFFFLVMPFVFVEKQDTVALNTSCVMDQLPHGDLAAFMPRQRCKMTFALETGLASMVTYTNQHNNYTFF